MKEIGWTGEGGWGLVDEPKPKKKKRITMRELIAKHNYDAGAEPSKIQEIRDWDDLRPHQQEYYLSVYKIV